VYKEKRTEKLRPRKNILYTILPVTSSSISYNKTHKKWRLKHEIKYYLYKIAQQCFKTPLKTKTIFKVFKTNLGT